MVTSDYIQIISTVIYASALGISLISFWEVRRSTRIQTEQQFVTAIEPMKFLLSTGQPLPQPVVARGPFVMNTQDEINEAFADYRAGVFGSIPTE